MFFFIHNIRKNIVTMAINPAKVMLRQGKSVLFICDIQEKFVKAILHFDKMVQNSARLVSYYTLHVYNYIKKLRFRLQTCQEVILFLYIRKVWIFFNITVSTLKYVLVWYVSICTCCIINHIKIISQINCLKILNVPSIVTEQNPKALGKTISEIDISRSKGPFAKIQFSMCTSEVSIYTFCFINKINVRYKNIFIYLILSSYLIIYYLIVGLQGTCYNLWWTKTRLYYTNRPWNSCVCGKYSYWFEAKRLWSSYCSRLLFFTHSRR